MEEWNTFYKGSRLTGCQERNLEYGIEAGCGSLGHGLPLAVGMAFAAKLQNLSWKVYCIAGDGEMQEGSMWESLQFAAWHKLSNLFLIIDKNNLQAMDFCDNILTLPNNPDDLKKKCEAFGFHSVQVNGHNTDSIADLLEQLDISCIAKPKAIIADTVKGYGLYCMENIPKFHFRLPTESELSMGCRYE
jgi:transketolase